MALHKIKKGLDLPIAGEPDELVVDSKPVTRVGLAAADYVGLKPRMFVKEGQTVKRGEALFEDRKAPGVIFTAPGAGVVSAVNRGEKRALQSVVIELNEAERTGNPGDEDHASFESYTGGAVAGLDRDRIRALLLESGLWTSIRQRPFGKVANPDIEPYSIFITAMDTNPLAPPVEPAYAGNEDAFEQGLLCLAKFREGRIFLCRAPGSKIAAGPHSGVSNEEFKGAHPAGTPGVHIHTLCPVNRERPAWYVDFRDVIAMGKLFMTGKLDVSKTIALAGPMVEKPRLIRTRLGAFIDELLEDELKPGEHRAISGSVLSGRIATGLEHGYLGRYHHQVSVLLEDRERVFLGWLGPGTNKFSVLNTFVSKLDRKKKFEFTTSTHGSSRPIIPIGAYEKVFPMDILPSFLLRSIAVDDIERAEELGILELDEEDVALCSFVCPGKNEFGPMLRRNLNQLEEEG